MVSISTSSSALSRIVLRLHSRHGGDGGEFALYDVGSVAANLDVVDGSVTDTGIYDVELLVPKGITLESAIISVNGDDATEWRPSSTNAGDEDVWYDTIELLPSPNGTRNANYQACLFCLCYGFARVEVAIKRFERAKPAVFTTKDIVCQTKEPYEAENIRGMLARLLDSTDDLASKWMFLDSRPSTAPFSLFEGSVQNNAPKSVSSVILLLKRALFVYSDNTEYFRRHGYSRIRQDRALVPISQIQRSGFDELLWITRNPELLDEVRWGTGLFYGGRSYLPRMMQTRKRCKTFDSYENRLVLGFLSEVVRTAAVVRASLKSGAEAVRALELRLLKLCAGNEGQPALALARLYRMREGSYLEQLDGIVREGSELLRRYRQFLPGVEEHFTRNPRRTKVFQEIRPYAQIWTMLEEWLRFGDFSLAKENLALHTLRADKLYEYYVLYELLDWLASRGFRPQANDSRAIRKASFSVAGDSDTLYQSEDGISSIYNLTSNNLRVTLFYQPVVYADEREEEGIVLHRLSRPSRHCPYWTPDYLFEVVLPSGQRTYHVIDAKYRRLPTLTENYPRGGVLAECVMKYRQDVGQSDGKGVSTVWLFAGRSNKRQVYYAERSAWAQRSWTTPRSGAATLAPGIICLDEYFANILSSNLAKTGSEAEGLIGIRLAETPKAETTEVSQNPPLAAIQNTISQEPIRKNGFSSNDISATASKEELNAKPSETEGLSLTAIMPISPDEAIGRVSASTDIDRSIIALVEELMGLLPTIETLYDARWANSRLSLERPLVRESPPKTNRERQYYRPIELNGRTTLLYAKWRPNQIARLVNLVRMLQRQTKKR